MSLSNKLSAPKTASLVIAMIISGLHSPASLAGEGSVGNGGNAVVCKDSSGKITSAELLDYYEARTELNFAIDLGDAKLDPGAKTKIAFDRLKVTAPFWGNWMEYKASVFVSQQAEFIPNASLTPVQDSNQVAVPSGCEVIQLAIQKQVSLPNQKTYTVNKDLWDLLDNTNKAGLILHEIIYTEALTAGAKDSVGVRYFNGLISSHQIDIIDLYSLLQVERQVPLQYFEYQGHDFKIDALNPYFHAHSGEFAGGPVNLRGGVTVNGAVRPVTEIYYDEWATAIERVVLAEPVNIDFHGFPIEFTGELMLDKNGKIRRGRVSPMAYFDFESPDYSLKPALVSNAPGLVFPAYVAEDENGQIVECGNCLGWVKVMGQQLNISRSGDETNESYNFFDPKTFADSGIRTLHLAQPASFTVTGNSISVMGQLNFNQDDQKGNYSIESGKLQALGVFKAGTQTMTLKYEFTLYWNGNVMKGTLAAPATLIDEAGNSETYPKDTVVEFDIKGLLQSANQY
jgi:hypothetical protein